MQVDRIELNMETKQAVQNKKQSTSLNQSLTLSER